MRQIQRIAFGNDRTILWGRSIKKINVCSMQARNQLDGIIGTRRIAARTDGHQRIGLRKGGIVLWGNAHATGKRQHNGLQTAQIGCNGCDAAGRAKRQVTPVHKAGEAARRARTDFRHGKGVGILPAAEVNGSCCLQAYLPAFGHKGDGLGPEGGQRGKQEGIAV